MYMTIDEIIDDVEYYITNPEKWTNYSTKRRSELRMMIEDLISQNSGKPIVSGSLPLFKCKCGYETSNSVAWCVHADCCNGNDR